MQENAQEPEVTEEEVPVAEEAVEETPIAEAPEAEEASEEKQEEEAPLTPEEELEKWKNAAIRATADLDNYRKRMARERAEDLRFARSGLIEELLPVFDNFSMGLQMAEQEQDSMIFKGMEMVKGQLDDFLAAQGVKPVKAEGVFDPNFHEAVAEEEKDGAEPGEILFVKRQGYLLHDRLIRAAAVIVAKTPEEESQPEEDAS